VEGTFTDFFGDLFHNTAGVALVTLVLDWLLPLLLPLLLRRLVRCGNGWRLAVDLREVGPCMRRDEAGVVRAFTRDVPALTAYLARVVENDGLTVEVWDLRGLVGAISLNLNLILILCIIVVVAFLAAVFGIVISHVAVGAVLAASVILLTICVSLPVATIAIFITVVIIFVAIAFLGGMAVPLTDFAILLLAAVVTTILLFATSTSAVLLATAASATASFTASHFWSLEMNVI
jgi:hypothetical protein